MQASILPLFDKKVVSTKFDKTPINQVDMADMWRWGGGGSVAHLIQQATQKKLLTGLDIFAFMLKKRFLFVYVIEGPLK